MKTISKLIAGIVLVSSFLNAARHTNKTFILPRPQAYYHPLEMSTWHRQVYCKSNRRSGVGLQATGYYRFSTNENGMGRYFGADSSRDLTVGKDSALHNIESRALIHRGVPLGDAQETDIAGTLRLSPEQEIWGVNLTYHQEIDFMFDGFYFNVHLPVVHLKNDLNLTLVDGCSQQDTRLMQDILAYFRGEVVQTTQCDVQAALTHAKIDGPQSKTDVADVIVRLGFSLAQDQFYCADVNIQIGIPIDDKNVGKHLFEPVIGTNDHWMLGMGFESNFNIYQGRRSAFECSCNVAYRYHFDATEVRTLGFKLDNKTTPQWSHFLLGATKGQKGVFPLANVLTRAVSVSPGSSLEGLVNFAFHTKTFTFDFGYNFYSRDCDKIDIPGTGSTCTSGDTWPDNTYAFANLTYCTVDEFDIGLGNTPPNNTEKMNIDGFINRDKLDLNTCATPANLTHTLYVAGGWSFNEDYFPIVIGGGGCYEFTDGNATFENVTLWAKLGFIW